MGLGAIGAGGEQELDTRTVSSDTTTVGDDLVLVNGGGVTVTISEADTTAGNSVVVKDAGGVAGGDPITVATEGDAKIDGAATATIGAAREGLTFVCDGTNWFVENARYERVEMRTDDPSDPSVGDVWFRSDLSA